MKILYLLHRVEVPVHKHIIGFLRSKDIIVDVYLIGPGQLGKNVWSELNSIRYANILRQKRYDFIISNTHSGALKPLFQRVKPRCGYIDIEHDIFSNIPVRFPKSFVFTFQDRHAVFCKKNKIPFIRCRWPKLDVPVENVSLGLDPWKEAVLIGTGSFNKIIEEGKSMHNLGFERLWYKKYLADWKAPFGTKALPDQFNGPIGLNYCLQNFKFVATRHSSAFVETLLMGGLPILLPDLITSEKKITDVVSEVTWDQKDSKISKFLTITTNNLQYKINTLRRFPYLFEITRKQLLDKWVKSDYYLLPPAYEAIYKHIRRF